MAGERLNKDYYFFFTKHLLTFTFLAINNNAFNFSYKNRSFNKACNSIFFFYHFFLALVPVFGIEVKGAKRWINFYFFSLQPIEILKPFFILMTVKIITLEKFKSSSIKYILSFLLLSSVVILLIDQPDLGQSILLIISWIATVFISGVIFFISLSFF